MFSSPRLVGYLGRLVELSQCSVDRPLPGEEDAWRSALAVDAPDPERHRVTAELADGAVVCLRCTRPMVTKATGRPTDAIHSALLLFIRLSTLG